MPMNWLRRALLRSVVRNQPTTKRQLSSTTKMASASTAVALYASVISASQIAGAVPEDAGERAHHAKGGKGFINPWPSFMDQSGWAIGRAMIM
jgi:N-acyl-phosphatidylethanolamine-hydrolysing phospholipase D